MKKKFTQEQLLVFTANMQTSLIGLEACAGAHFLGRALRKQGHDVRLIPVRFVKPFVQSNKNDFIDAEAIAEAVERKNMRFVPIKTDDLLDLQAIHRVRDRLISRRTAVISQLRAFLLERGMVFAQTPAMLKAAIADILENAEANLIPQMRNLIEMLWGEDLRCLDGRNCLSGRFRPWDENTCGEQSTVRQGNTAAGNRCRENDDDAHRLQG